MCSTGVGSVLGPFVIYRYKKSYNKQPEGAGLVVHQAKWPIYQLADTRVGPSGYNLT
jgi:hypothetical protein